MRCHYEVLGVPQSATNDDLKKAYRKMALQWHPDKNPDQLEEAKKQFQLVQAAYETLTDPQERAFYDRNRDSFLRNHGADGGSGKGSHGIDLYGFMSSQCYSGFNDSKKGFYTVYRQLFEEIAVQDMRYVDEDDDVVIPSFGHSDMDLEEVGRFYTYWSGYCTSMAFEWADEFDIREAHQMGRWVEKKIEKENSKARQKARKQFNEEVRALVLFVRKRDKRWQERKKMQAAKAEEKAKKQKEAQERERKERNKLMAESIQQEKAKMAAYEDQLREMEARFADEWGVTESEESDYEDEEFIVNGDPGDGTAELDGEAEDIAAFLMDDLYCVACNKTFKTERAMESHERGKKHRENIEALKVTMMAENELLEEDSVADDTSRLVDSGSAGDDETITTLPKSSKKKKKKKSKQTTVEELTPSTSTSIKGDTKSKKKKRQQLVLEDSSDSVGDTEKTENSEGTVINGHENSEDVSRSEALERESSCDVEGKSDRAEVSAKPKKGKKAKEERRKAREASAAANPSEVHDLRCSVCGSEFPSKNKLFGHIKAEGHAALKTNVSSQTGKKGKVRAK